MAVTPARLVREGSKLFFPSKGAACLTAAVSADGTGSLRPLRIGLKGGTSLTAVTSPGEIERVRNFTAQLEGATSLTAVAPSIFLSRHLRGTRTHSFPYQREDVPQSKIAKSTSSTERGQDVEIATPVPRAGCMAFWEGPILAEIRGCSRESCEVVFFGNQTIAKIRAKIARF
jgi:hypothetical protein